MRRVCNSHVAVLHGIAGKAPWASPIQHKCETHYTYYSSCCSLEVRSALPPAFPASHLTAANSASAAATMIPARGV
jgi:hypothetical protein